jgi:hypothetical protein
MGIRLEHIRCGNWFISQNGKPFQWGLQEFKLLAEGKELADIIKDPVSITAAVLLECGFKKYSEVYRKWNFEWLNNGWFTLEFDSTETGSYSADISHIKYVHQLQNFQSDYYNIELKINLYELPLHK